MSWLRATSTQKRPPSAPVEISAQRQYCSYQLNDFWLIYRNSREVLAKHSPMSATIRSTFDVLSFQGYAPSGKSNDGVSSAGENIPLGWAVDQEGNPTDDPNAALEGSLVSAGDHKGYGFGLMAEVLAAAVTGCLNSVSAPPLKAPEGPAHDLEQFYFLIDPTVFSGDAFWERLETLAESIQSQPNSRLPGARYEEVHEVSINGELWQADFFDQPQLYFQPVSMIFLGIFE